MPFLTGTIELQMYTDSAQTEFPKELFPSVSKDFTNNSVTEAQTTIISLAANGGTQVVALNGVATVKGAYFYSNATDLVVNINGLGNMTFQAQTPGFIPATITSLTLTNNDVTNATTVTVVLIAS